MARSNVPTMDDFKRLLNRWAFEVKNQYPEETQKGMKIRTFRDPLVAGTYAARVEIGDEKIDFLFVGNETGNEIDRREKTLGRELNDDERYFIMEGCLEECEFDTWPPKSSEENMAKSIFQ